MPMSGRKGIVSTEFQANVPTGSATSLVFVLNKHSDRRPGPCYHQYYQKCYPSHYDMYGTIAQHPQFHHIMCQQLAASAKKNPNL